MNDEEIGNNCYALIKYGFVFLIGFLISAIFIKPNFSSNNSITGKMSLDFIPYSSNFTNNFWIILSLVCLLVLSISFSIHYKNECGRLEDRIKNLKIKKRI